MYDAIIDLSPKVKYPSLYISQKQGNQMLVKRQTYTLGDLYLWRQLRSRIDSQTLVSSPPYGLIDLVADIWSSLFGIKNSIHIPSPASSDYHEENDDEDEDEDDEVRLFGKALNPTPAITSFMKSYSNAILASLLTLTLKPDHDYNSNGNVRDDDHTLHNEGEEGEEDSPLELTASDLLSLGLSPLSDVDSLIAKSISKTELGRNVNISISCAWSVASFVRRQCLSIGWI